MIHRKPRFGVKRNVCVGVAVQCGASSVSVHSCADDAFDRSREPSGRRQPVVPEARPEKHEAVLSPGEAAVIEQLRRGKNQVIIARETGRSVETVRTMCKNVREKFGAHSVKELLRGFQEGVYVIARRPRGDSPAFGLASALVTLKRERDRQGTRDQMRTVRLHREEISAILRLASAGEPSAKG